MTHRNLALALILCATGVAAQVGGAPTIQQDEARERDRIAQTRAAAQASFAAQEAQCYQLFAVSDCLIKVRRERRDLLADLRRQELSLNDARRKRRAAQQLLQSDEKASRTP